MANKRLLNLGHRAYIFYSLSDEQKATGIYAHCIGDQNEFEKQLKNTGIDFSPTIHRKEIKMNSYGPIKQINFYNSDFLKKVSIFCIENNLDFTLVNDGVHITSPHFYKNQEYVKK